MNDFEKSMFIFFDEWGGTPEFQAEHNELYFSGVDVDELIEELPERTYGLINDLFDLGWHLDHWGNSFVSSRWGTG